MIHAVRKLARDIHRLAVWQVIVGYGCLAWVARWSVSVATLQLGLPAWTPGMATVLLAIGFPVVLATAVVQGGLPGLRIEDVADPNELPGRTPAEVHVIPELHPMYGAGLLTWRNAILGGVMAAALLVTTVVAYFSMWVLGIGPVGSLQAQGVISEGDRVIVADLANRTERVGLGRWISDALRADLGESELVSRVEREAALDAIGRAATGSLDARAAVEAASLLSAAAVIDGEVERSGSGFLVTVRVHAPPTGDRIARIRGSADSPAQLVDALDLLAERLRSKLGEPLGVIRAGTTLGDLVGEAPGQR